MMKYLYHLFDIYNHKIESKNIDYEKDIFINNYTVI